MSVFKKLFTIDYKNKKFLILVDKYHRKTFLEVTPDGKYLYPEYEDFKALHEIYNNYDYTVKYDNLYVSYDERIKEGLKYFTLNTLAVISLVNSIMAFYPSKREFELVVQKTYKDTYKDRDTLELVYGSEVITREDVIEAINNNSKISERYKEIAIRVLDNNLTLDPEADLRIYYENMKDLEILILHPKDLEVIYSKNIAGCFLPRKCRIALSSEYANDDIVVAHEFTHAFHTLCDTTSKDVIEIYETFGHSLEEAMTERITGNMCDDCNHYYQEQMVLEFFIDNVDEFNYHTYNTDGITALINELKAKYPDVDIDYLIDYLDTMTKSNIYFSKNIQLYQDENFVDELFKITIKNIDKDDIYRSFDTFKAAIGGIPHPDFFNNYFDSYLELYNQELVKRGFIFENTVDLINEINTLCIVDGKFYFSVSNDSYLDYDGNKVKIDNSSEIIFLPINDKIKNKILQNCVNTGENVYTLKNIQSLLNDNSFYTSLSIYKYDETEIKQILDNLLVFETANFDAKNLYLGFNPIYTFISYCPDSRSQLHDEYMERYDKEIVKCGFLSEAQMAMIRSTMAITKCDENMYLLYNHSPFEKNVYDCYFLNGSSLGHRYRFFTYSDSYELEHYNDNGEQIKTKINGDTFELIQLSSQAQNIIIQYMVDNNIKNVASEDCLNGLNDKFNLFESKKYNTYSDGKVAFDEINDNMYVEVGYNENNGVGLMLFDGDELIYGTCRKLLSPTAKIPFKIYVQLITYDQYNYLDEIISFEAFSSLRDLLLKYYMPSLDIHYERTGKMQAELGYPEYETVYDFNAPVKVFVDGKECSLRNIYIYENETRGLVLHLPSDKDIVMGNLNETEYWFVPNNYLYFEFFDQYLRHLNIFPDENNTYDFTESDIIKIVNDYINSENTKDHSRL